jgi:hypothetical protein
MEITKEMFHIDETNSESGPVVRWNSNKAIPPTECIDQMLTLGYIDTLIVENSICQREVEQDLAIAAYKKAMENHVPDAEELFEMRAAFGEGAVVVNAITGRRIQL